MMAKNVLIVWNVCLYCEEIMVISILQNIAVLPRLIYFLDGVNMDIQF